MHRLKPDNRKSKRDCRILCFVTLVVFILPFGIALQTVSSKTHDVLDTIARKELREQWKHEREEHSELQVWTNERQVYEQETAQWARTREAWKDEQARHNEADRRWEKEDFGRMQLYWGHLERNEHCYAYATRKYSAQLRHLPADVNRVAACKNTPITIHGRNISEPSVCDDKVRISLSVSVEA